MAGKYNPTVVGSDAFFREICIGDEIQDLDGRHYTVDKYGRCKPLDGGNTVPLSSVKEAALVSRYEGPPLDVTDRKPAPSPAPKSEKKPEPSPAPKSEKKPEPKTEPAIVQGTVSPRGGRANRSGVTSFWNLSRSLGFPAAQLKEVAQENGFEIVRAQGANRNTGIRIEEVERFRALLPEQGKKERKPRSVTKEPEKVFIQEDPATAPEPEKVLPPFDENPLAGYTDQSLADELRRRGFELHAVKRIEL